MAEAAAKPGRKDHFVVDGLKFPKDYDLLSPRIRMSLRGGAYEPTEAAALRRLVGPEDTVLELGAGIGFMSALAAGVQKARNVMALEANPRLVPYIEKVYAANGITNARVINAVLGAAPGKAPFHIRRNILASSLDEVPGTEVLETVEIEVLEARAVIEELRPTVLICDIEGAEARVIPAMPLEGLRAAVVELHPQWIAEAGVRSVFSAFMEAGLTYFPKLSAGKVVCFRRDW